MEGFSGYNYLQYAEEGSPETESGSSNSPTGDIMLAEYHPKKPAGRKKFKETRHPVYRGIRQRNSGKWVCEVREPNKTTRIWLGTYSTAEMAARAHDVAAIALRGRNACLNFADSLWRLPVPESGETKDIQRAAAEAAEAFQPRSTASEAEPAAATSGVEGKMDDGVAFMAEEEWFEMPEIIADMYNGMMLPPPEHTYVADDFSEYDVDVDLPLWSY